MVKAARMIQSMVLQIMEKRGQMMKTWGQSASNDAAAHRVTGAGREDVNLRELMVKENERSKESEKEFVHAEELKGDRRKVFPTHT